MSGLPITDSAAMSAGGPPQLLGWCARCLADGRFEPAATLFRGTSMCEDCVKSRRAASAEAVEKVATHLPDPVAAPLRKLARRAAQQEPSAT